LFDNSGEEHALFAGGKFKGKCHHCGKFGDKGSDCFIKDPSKRPKNGGGNGLGRGGRGNSGGSSGGNSGGSNGSKRFQGKCHYCQREGHRIKDCHKKKRDEGANTSAVAAVATENNSEQADVLFVAMEGFSTGAGVRRGYRIDPGSDYSTDEDPSNPGACTICGDVGPEFTWCGKCPEGSGGFYEPMSVEQLALHWMEASDRGAKERRRLTGQMLTEMIIEHMWISSERTELRAFFNLTGSVYYVDCTTEMLTQYARDQMYLAIQFGMENVPDVMWKSFQGEMA
jgi:hypothetical protein